MYHFICYLKGGKSYSYIVKMLCAVFNVKAEEIGDLLCGGSYVVRFENRLLDDISEFCTELNVYVANKEKILDLKLYNDFFFGAKVSAYIDDEVLISGKGDDPYQWILVKEQQLFLVEEIGGDSEGISLIPAIRSELSCEEASKILSDIAGHVLD